jgi:hypothetical protein
MTLSIEIRADQILRAKTVLSSPAAVRGASDGVRLALGGIERWHKTREMIRGAGVKSEGRASALADPTNITSRTGQLSRSYRIYFKRGDLVGFYGSDLRRARLLEVGGTVKPVRGRMLAIPSAYAKVGQGAALWPSQYPKGELFRIGRVLYKAKKLTGRSDLIPMFFLVPSVTIKSRPGLKRTSEAMSLRCAQLIAEEAVKAMQGESRGA